MTDNPLGIPIIPSLSLAEMLESFLPLLDWIPIALLAVLAAYWFFRRYAIVRRQKRRQHDAELPTPAHSQSIHAGDPHSTPQ
jgi:hypothetical protein